MVNDNPSNKPRTPLRRTPLKAGSKPLKARKAWNPPRKALASRSEKTSRVYREERVPLVKRMLQTPSLCELGPAFRAADPTYSLCQGRAEVVHELRKRSSEGSILNPDNLRRSCVACNEAVENFPRLALRAGLVVRSSDPLWEQLGEANDRKE